MEDRQREQFAVDELAVVLSQYDLGPIESITEFPRGSRKSPKVGIVCQRGKFLLKRRPRGHVTSQRLTYAHRLQRHLTLAGFPLPRLIAPAEGDGLVLHHSGHVYELFDYVRGQRFSGSTPETREAGITLARFHKAVEDFTWAEPPHRGDYHDANPVRTGLSSIPSSLSAHDSVAGMEIEVLEISQELYDAYERSCERVERIGLRKWPTGVIHGDWHPGNMMYRNGKVVAVVDYDSARVSQRVIDLANGTLQFSILSGKQVEDWPDEIDEDRAGAFLAGYRAELPITDGEQGCLPYLMMEALISESVLPIAATGSFGRHQGFRFMRMVHRKVGWLEANAERLTGSLVASA
ncbi:MAG TPA: phosphotransferase [Phycisphaerae bacterium]|nr:phosphotransferase [Phycisphaerae bacterium]